METCCVCLTITVLQTCIDECAPAISDCKLIIELAYQLDVNMGTSVHVSTDHHL